MIGTPLTRLSVMAMALTAIGVAVAFAAAGGEMFSPGALHAGDASRERYGGVVSHAELSRRCSACHAIIGSTRPMAVRCLECHTDVQRQLADTSTLHGAIKNARACGACHTEHQGAAASLTNISGFGSAHDALGFSLATHTKQSNGDAFTCASCHTKASFKFQAATCASCHREYQAAFVAKHVASWGNDCQSCHDGRDRFSKGRFRHDSTAYPLTGAHAKTECVACHTGVTQLRGYALAKRTCNECHAADDRHKGSLGTNCASCHSTDSWKGARFEHSVFPVDHGARRASECKTCHQDANNYKRYTCYGCHEHSPARVQAQHRGEVRTQNLDNCLACHAGGRKEGGEGGEGEGEEREGRRRERRR